MTKSKRKVNAFINHLFTLYHVPRIPVHIHWHYPSLVDDQGNYGFGVLSLRDSASPCIHIAAKVLGKTGVMRVFAHEFGHYLQHLYGQNFDEEVAEEYANVIMNVCKFNRKHLVFVRFDRFIKLRNMRIAFPIYINGEGKHSVVPPKGNKEAPSCQNPSSALSVTEKLNRVKKPSVIQSKPKIAPFVKNAPWKH